MAENWRWLVPKWEVPAGNRGSCIYQTNPPIQDNELNSHDSSQ